METGLTEARFAENRAQSVGELDGTHSGSAAAPDQHDSSPAWMVLALSVEDASRGPGGTPISPERAQQLTVELRRYPRAVDRDGFVQMLRRAFEGNAHGVLAFDSWRAFVSSLRLDESFSSVPKDMPCHPAAELFPMLEGGDFAQLVDDMRMHGQRVPIITTSDGLILDGRNRARACQHLGLNPITEVYAGDDPVAFVVSANLRRRHLTDSQRAMIAARLATLGQGKPAALPVKPPTQAEAAARLDVSERSVRDAAKVRREGSPELVAAVERGEVPVSRAARDVRASHARKPALDSELREHNRPAEKPRAADPVTAAKVASVNLEEAANRLRRAIGGPRFGLQDALHDLARAASRELRDRRSVAAAAAVRVLVELAESLLDGAPKPDDGQPS